MSKAGLSVGEVLGQYRIVEEIGAGGMGVVYRARDERLDRDVALKILASDALTDEEARKRFRSEALALSRLNHPNIAIVHDFNTHQGIDVLVTEYIPGETLDTRITSGPMAERDILRLAIQLAEGLDAAHEQSIVHRDLKPGNLRLTPTGRLKILDFGLARQVAFEGERTVTVALTESQQITGTLPYMAPEQLRGERIDVRSDIWAAGCVLYELATGRRPFAQHNTALLIDAILNASPEPPRTLNPQLSPGLEAIILRALEKKPERRYQSSREMLAALEALSVSSQHHVIRSVARSRRVSIAAVALVALLLTAVGSFYFLRRAPIASVEPPIANQPRMRRSVAVLGFKNLSGKPDVNWISTALSEMLNTELAVGEELRTVPGESVARLKTDLSLVETDSLAQDTLARVRSLLGTDLVVLGSYLATASGAGNQIRLDLRLQDTAAGETIASISERGSEAKLDELVMRAGAKLRERLQMGQVSSAAMAQVRASLPANLDAARLYSEGLRKLRVFDALSARDLLSNAAEADPKFALTHSALSSAWEALGYDSKAAEEAKIAFDLSASLSRQDRLWIEANYRESNGELDKAIELYRTLFDFYPDEVQYGLRLAGAQVINGDAKAALAVLEKIRHTPGAGRNDARIDISESVAARAIGDMKRAHQAATAAVKKGQEQGARLLVARARLMEGIALRRLGEPAAAITALDETRRIYAEVGDRSGLADALNTIANIRADQGDYAGARKLYEEVLATHRASDNKAGMAGALDNIATILADRGDPAAALPMSEQALALFQQVGNKNGMADVVNNIAGAYVQMGRYDEGEKRFYEALELRREIGDRDGEAVTLHNLGDIAQYKGNFSEADKSYGRALQTFRDLGEKGNTAFPLGGLGNTAVALGQLDRAASYFEQALTVCKETEDRSQSAFALAGLGRVQHARGDLAGARQKLQESLSIRQELGENANIADSRTALAQLEIDENRASDATSLAREAAREFHAQRRFDDEVLARTVLARALLSQGKNSEAAKEVAAARALAPSIKSPITQAALTLEIARVQSAGARPPSNVLRWVKGVVDGSSRSGNVPLQFEATLLLGELELRAGVAGGRARLEQLLKDADTKGFGHIASRADAVLR